ncbi:MAG: translation initiation factor IF-2 N-terminal domain-containing protein, partial [Lachnospiraceae bacterium]|nr:translation initiation factor IF-2 N-terminal domain-containing protein [Lachnospiraceae bacterium]
MAKIRIYALGKELGVGNPEIIEYLGKQGIEVKSASSSVEEDVADRVRKAFGKTSSAATEPERSSEPEKPAKPEQPEKPARQESPAEPERPAKQDHPKKPVKQE